MIGFNLRIRTGWSLSLESVDNIYSCHGLPLGVLGVGDGIADYVLQEHLQDTACLLVDQSRDTLGSTSANQTPDGGLGDTLNVITERFPLKLSATLSKTLSSFTTARHVDCSDDFE